MNGWNSGKENTAGLTRAQEYAKITNDLAW